MDHDAQLEDELRSRLQEGFKETEHGDVSTLKHQAPVEVATGPVAVPTALGAQIESMDVSKDERQGDSNACCLIISLSSLKLLLSEDHFPGHFLEIFRKQKVETSTLLFDPTMFFILFSVAVHCFYKSDFLQAQKRTKTHLIAVYTHISK